MVSEKLPRTKFPNTFEYLLKAMDPSPEDLHTHIDT